MVQDREGNELHAGDIVGVLFEVTNIVADSERLNLLVRHASPHHGLPDDWRLQLSSSQVELVKAAPAPAAALVAAAASGPEIVPDPAASLQDATQD
jgi:hypothetical protein